MSRPEQVFLKPKNAKVYLILLLEKSNIINRNPLSQKPPDKTHYDECTPFIQIQQTRNGLPNADINNSILNGGEKE